jgi:protein-L-isoaspartate(D-aspartate) O-methyltransferase
VTAGADHVPQPLIDQLAVGARMVIPVGDQRANQVLKVIEKLPDGTVDTRDVTPVRFVPLRRR